jgi:hypothetical protein
MLLEGGGIPKQSSQAAAIRLTAANPKVMLIRLRRWADNPKATTFLGSRSIPNNCNPARMNSTMPNRNAKSRRKCGEGENFRVGGM